VHPGGIKTNIARSGRVGGTGSIKPGSKTDIAQNFDKIATTSPEKAAHVILKGVRNNRRRILVGADALVIDGMQRLMPTGYQRLLEFGAKRSVAR
jgi:short-subunit dehydrogenase